MKYLTIPALLLFFSFGYSQTLLRSSIGCMGQSYTTSQLSIQQTIGQSTVPGTVSAGGTDLRQGFIQPPLGAGISKLNDCHINLWPNPTKGDFTFTATSTSKEGTISYTVHNITGSLLLEGRGSFNAPINISDANLAQGLYFLTVTDGQAPLAICKFIIER